MISGKLINNRPIAGTLSTQLNTSGVQLTTVNQHKEGVMRLYAAENVVAYLTGVKGHSVNTDKDFNTIFSVYTEDNKTYKFSVDEFHYAMFEGEKIYITQIGRRYEQSQADKAAQADKEAKAKFDAAEKVRIDKINARKIEKYDSLVEELADAEIEKMILYFFLAVSEELLQDVLNIISSAEPLNLDDIADFPAHIRAALHANKEKYKRRYK